jgi:hypothetical protein
VKLRRLNAAGIERMSTFLDGLTAPAPEPPPYAILEDPALSEPVSPEIEVEKRAFTSRFELAQYLDDRLGAADVRGVDRDSGIWAWLALLFFESLCVPDRDGRRKPGARARWIPEVSDFRRYYRHLLAGPYLIYRAHRDDPRRALILLCGPPGTMGDIVEQLASRQEIVTNKTIVGAATRLYYDPARRAPRRGAGGKGPGSARRLADVISQFDLTWDLYEMSGDDLFKKLPDEFERFKSAA